MIAVPGGLYLLELKGHPGRVVNHGDIRQFHGDRVRTIRTPLHLTDLKAKELKSRLERAARVSQAPAGVRPDSGIGTEDLLTRVRARFPGLAVLSETTYVELGEALAGADSPLLCDPDRRRFVPQQREGTGSRPALSSSVLTSTGSLYAAAQGSIAEGRDPREVVTARLLEARRRGGFLALTLTGAELRASPPPWRSGTRRPRCR